ncbi:MAG: amidohydrolase family protein [Acidobacteriota bacterium]|nr:amidohydrolase family protein [Acidobacteriota bacterium]
MKKLLAGLAIAAVGCVGLAQAPAKRPTVLHAARLLDVAAGRVVSPGEVLVVGERIVAAGIRVDRPSGAEVIDLGDRTLVPGLIDAHVHLFLHPGAEDLQTVEESVPQRVILAEIAAKADLMAGFTAERDMGTEGAGSASTAVRNAIDAGLIPGPRMRMSGNAIDIMGGHEDAIGYNPAARVPSNADYADSAEDLVRVMRLQHKEGADFAKIYETGKDSLKNGVLTTPYQYSEAELHAAVVEEARLGSGATGAMGVAVHCTGEPAAAFAVAAGVASIDHAFYLSDTTMAEMKTKQIYAVPTFAILEYFGAHSPNGDWNNGLLAFHAAQFKRQLAAGVPFAMGSDVGPFPHGTQARELELMVKFGMAPADALRADLLNGARLLGWAGEIGELKAGFYADVIAAAGNPLEDISTLGKVDFVMKGGEVYRRP